MFLNCYICFLFTSIHLHSLIWDLRKQRGGSMANGPARLVQPEGSARGLFQVNKVKCDGRKQLTSTSGHHMHVYTSTCSLVQAWSHSHGNIPVTIISTKKKKAYMKMSWNFPKLWKFIISTQTLVFPISVSLLKFNIYIHV